MLTMWLLQQGGGGGEGGGGKLLCSASWMCYKVVVPLIEAIYKCLPGLSGTLLGLWGRQAISYKEGNILS